MTIANKHIFLFVVLVCLASHSSRAFEDVIDGDCVAFNLERTRRENMIGASRARDVIESRHNSHRNS